MPPTIRTLVITLLAVAALFLGLRILGPPTSIDYELAPIALDDDALIARGRYLAIAGNCGACHTVEGGELMAGGLPFETPFGTIYSTNITPDEETGIGNWTAEQFLESMRFGVRPDGTHLYPAFPYTSFTRVTDNDVSAIYAYLMNLPAVGQTAPGNDLSFPFNMRVLLVAWKALFFTDGVFVAEETESEEWNRGAYLVEGLAHCGACHTPRNMMGAEDNDRFMAGGEYLDKVHGGVYRPWSAPNLTSSETGLSLWLDADLLSYLRTGRNRFLDTFGPMNEVVMDSTRHLSVSDTRAMTTYLKSLPAVSEDRRRHADQQVLGRGRTIYNLYCGTCHLPTGLGDTEMGPKLNDGSLVVQAENPASMINVILYGPELPDPPLAPRWWEPMDEHQYLLDDEEIAAVASFIRHSWDNPGGLVTPDQVARQR